MRQDRINTENQLMVFSDCSLQDFPDTYRSTGAYIVFYQCGPIDHCTHVSGLVAQSNAESGYNSAHTAVMAVAQFRMLNNGSFNKDTYVVP